MDGLGRRLEGDGLESGSGGRFGGTARGGESGAGWGRRLGRTAGELVRGEGWGDGRWTAWCDGLGEQFVNVISITMIFQ